MSNAHNMNIILDGNPNFSKLQSSSLEGHSYLWLSPIKKGKYPWGEGQEGIFKIKI